MKRTQVFSITSVAKTALIACAATFLFASVSQRAHAQTFSVIYSFGAGADGWQPLTGVTLDRGGNLYGNTCLTSQGLGGTVFQLRKRSNGTWFLNALHQFTPQNGDGACPSGRVVFGPDGTLYGTTEYGGISNYGVVYRLSPPVRACQTAICNWNESILYKFTGGADGEQPGYVDPVFDNAGNLYGTTQSAGSGGSGTVFELTPSTSGWTESSIHSFVGSDGSRPASSLIFDRAGNIYGTTADGTGENEFGNVFELSPSGSGWVMTILHSFNGYPDGDNPFSGLTFDAAGNLYGNTLGGGRNGSGAAFQLTPSDGGWTYGLTYDGFGGGPDGPLGQFVIDGSGNLYGTSYGPGLYAQGAVFKLTNVGGTWTYTSLHDFTGGSDGGFPVGGVAIDANGNIYGTASTGGRYNRGVVWEITP